MRRPTAVLAAIAACALAAPAGAAWTGPFSEPVAKNPADALASLPIEAGRYDRAKGCTRKTPAPGATALATWLERNARGSSWGIVRCERWGKGSASLHAEGRALDWHLDAGVPADRAAARRLIALLLAPDRKGRSAALARRMGVQEIIFDCKSWFGGGPRLTTYSACRRKGVDRTTAHRDHIHFGLTKDGAAKRTSFWTRRAPALAKREQTLLPDPVEELVDDWLLEEEEPPLDDGGLAAG